MAGELMAATLAILALAAVGLVGWSYTTRVERRAGPAPGASWVLPEVATPYRLAIQSAEGRHAIPPGLLGRLLYQESRFRPEVINGAVKSSAGAVGIAQIVPKWHPNVDPTNPFQSIEYAANYLAALKSQFGSWELALAAYNWGPGNLRDALDESGGTWPTPDWPQETRSYVADITRDVPAARSV